ncbi:MAG: alpha/beta fold hydrolase [Vicinamibacterales bacterium]|nr:alpha/beta fold hydrolase [Vicinamibacterales bacterium]
MMRPHSDDAAGSGVLALHGLTGSPRELAPLTGALSDAGFRVDAPMLPGHGHDARMLARATRVHWRRAAGDAFTGRRAATGAPVAVIGGSMGALLALELAAEQPADVSALVLLAPPLRMPFRTRLRLVSQSVAARSFPLPRLRQVRKEAGIDVCDRAVVADLRRMDVCPLASLLEFVALMQETEALHERVRCPVLLVHGDRDRTVPRAHVEELAGRLSAPVETLWLPRSAHLVAVDFDRDVLVAHVLAFLGRLRER